jgi:HPt (histidine-containing phosphotransfer) domain-containing protein
LYRLKELNVPALSVASPAWQDGFKPSFERPLDLVHLARQTLGDRALEREILALFRIQAQAICRQLAEAAEGQRADLAHTLKGSARAVGAWQVAERAEACEIAAGATETHWKERLDALHAAIELALSAIDEIAVLS